MAIFIFMLNLKFTKRMKYWFLLLVVVLLPKISFSQYKFEKVRELRVNSLFSVGIVDYLSSQDLYLGFINKRSKGLEVALINGKGEIVTTRSLQGEGPEQYVTSMNGLGFSNDGNIWVLTTFELLLYGQNLKLKERVKFDPDRQVYIAGRTYPFQFFFKNNDPASFCFLLNPSGVHDFLGFKQFINKDLVNIYDSKTNSSYSLGPISKRAVPQKLAGNMADVYFPIFTIDRKKSPKMYLTSSFDKEITVIDLNTGREVSSLKINHEAFTFLDRSSLSIDDLPSKGNITLSAKNHNIFKLDNGLVLLEYVREIPHGVYEKKISEDPSYHHFKDPSYHRIIVFDQTKQVSKDLAIPHGTIRIAMPNNRILVEIENLEKEENFVKYAIYELVKD